MAYDPTTRRTAISTGVAVALAAVVLLTLLGHNRLTDWDEGIYAGVAAGISRSTSLSGWLIPHWNAQPWLEKPPLMLWITAVFFRLFGVSEFTARLGSALSGVALVGLLHCWLTVRRGPLTAWLNTVVLLSTFGFQHVARVGEMDVLLSLACTLALIGLCELQRDSPAGWPLFWTGFALAVMTKGAASVTLPATLVLALAFLPALRRRARSFASGAALFLLLVLPWHLYMLHRFGYGFLYEYLGLHVFTRATSQIEGHLTPWYFYLRVLLVSAAPWVLLCPFALWDALKSTACPVPARFGDVSRAPQRPVTTPQISLRPFALFALAALVLFSAAQTRLPHYIAPVYPALSVLTAAWLADRLGPQLTARARALPLAAAAVAVYVAAALLTAAPRRALHAPRLPNGNATPDNREQTALLKQVFQHPSTPVATTPGPLLTLRTGSYNPIPTTVFYAARPVQQVALCPLPGAPYDKYTNDPVDLAVALDDGRPHLLLADRALLAQVPARFDFRPVATGPTLTLGLIAMR